MTVLRKGFKLKTNNMTKEKAFIMGLNMVGIVLMFVWFGWKLALVLWLWNMKLVMK